MLNDKKTYTQEELAQLHDVLYDILAELIRVCKILKIPYFLQGGSAIGAFYEQGILPWDDDIDVGMIRSDYERFLKEAPKHLRDGYFLQWYGSEPHFPMGIAKLRKDGTLFVDKDFANLQMHQGIFIDIMAYDKVPDNKTIQLLHRKTLCVIYMFLYGTELWWWTHLRKPNVEHPADKLSFMCILVFIVTSLFPKHSLYKIYIFACKLFNNANFTYYNQAKESRDHISVDSLKKLQCVPFGPLFVNVPDNLEAYLKHHYPNIRKDLPESEHTNHYPRILSFHS